MSETLSTKDYDIFKFLEGNRELVPGHVERLKRSISFNNLLKVKPILVNERMEVIDGQHRLTAAKALSLPIYYQIEKGLDHTDLIAINVNVKPWHMLDYWNYWCGQNKPHYLKLKEISDKVDVPVQQLINYLCRDKRETERFKKGQYEVLDEMKIVDSFSKIQETDHIVKRYLHVKERTFLQQRFFRKALVDFLNREDVDFDTWKRKLELGISKLRQCSGITEYTRMLASIYNYRSQSPIMV